MLKAEAQVPEEPKEERCTWLFRGSGEYRDHAVTRYDGLAPETTDQPGRRRWAYIQLATGAVEHGPSRWRRAPGNG